MLEQLPRDGSHAGGLADSLGVDAVGALRENPGMAGDGETRAHLDEDERVAKLGARDLVGRLLRRHRGVVASAAAVLLALIAGLASTIFMMLEAEEQARLADQEAAAKDALLRRARALLLAHESGALVEEDPALALRLAVEAAAQRRQRPVEEALLRALEAGGYVESRTIAGGGELTVSSDGERFAVSDELGARVIDRKGGRTTLEMDSSHQVASGIAFDTASSRVAFVQSEGPPDAAELGTAVIFSGAGNEAVRIAGVATRSTPHFVQGADLLTLLTPLDARGSSSRSQFAVADATTGDVLAHFPGERFLGVAPRAGLVACEDGSGVSVRSLDGTTDSSVEIATSSVVVEARFSSDESKLFLLQSDVVSVWRVADGVAEGVFEHGLGDASGMAVGGEERWLVVFGPTGVSLVDLSTGEPAWTLARGSVHAAALTSGDGVLVVERRPGAYRTVVLPLDPLPLARRLAAESSLTLAQRVRFDLLRPVDLRARALLEEFERYERPDEFVHRMRQRESVAGEVLDVVEQYAHERGAPSASALNETAWNVVTRGGLKPQDYQNALRCAEVAASLDPDRQHVLNTLGAAQFRTGQYDAARSTLERSNVTFRQENGETSFDAAAFLALLSHEQGRRSEAKEWFQALRNLPLVTPSDERLLREVGRLLGR